MGNPIANSRGKPATMTRLLAVFALAAGILAAGPNQAHASTSQFRGVNWADQRDNFVNGVVHPSGLGASDTYASASAVADQVVGQMYAATGANTVRMPINEPTVADYWNTYTGAIDTALTKGNVILAYWAYSGGKPASTAGFNQVWDLRFNTPLTVADIASMGSYLQSGGRMYLTGENSSFDITRNQSLVAFLNPSGRVPSHWSARLAS